jgi:hypothetical protein
MTKEQRALLVIVLTPHIREYLEENDPVALRQARAALGESVIEAVTAGDKEVV